MLNEGIYIEAVLFVVIFGIMSIVSIIISKRNAKKYEFENPLEDRRATRRKEELEKELRNKVPVKKQNDIEKLLELSKMLKDGTIDEKEFKALKENLNI